MADTIVIAKDEDFQRYLEDRLIEWYLNKMRTVIAAEEQRMLNGEGVGRPLGVFAQDSNSDSNSDSNP